MHADSHFVIGAAHVTGGKPCQDYAAAGNLPRGGAYAVVSDGCSSGGATDLGARLVTLATVRGLRSASQPPPVIVGLERAAIIADTAARLDLTSGDLLATCLYVVSHGSDLTIHIEGDGVVAWQYSSGEIDAMRVEWDGNTPVYPSYSADGYAAFVAHHGGDLAAERVTAETWRYYPDGSYESIEDRRYSLGYALTGITFNFSEDVSIQRAAVFSDGVSQIDNIGWPKAVVGLLNFKTTTGEFAKRRLNRFVKDSQRLGRGPIDDLAYAVIDFTPQEES